MIFNVLYGAYRGLLILKNKNQIKCIPVFLGYKQKQKIRFKITFILNYTNYENERENDRNAMSREERLSMI